MRQAYRLYVFLWLCMSVPLLSAAPLRPGGLPEGVNPGELKVLNIDGEPPQQALQLPLEHTDVQIEVAGFVARATVTQHYSNPLDKPIEAVYVFPLPHKAAVDGMIMHVGDKTIRGLIKKRDEARQIYQQAKAEGKRTSLLEQERPNIFTQSVGNILPGDQISIEITYVDLLDYRDEGAFELVFPMVVGPRYIPGEGLGRSGSGMAADTDQVPDASRITPKVLKPGERSGHDISLKVVLNAGLKIHGLHATSHKVEITEQSDSQRTIVLHPTDTIPNKDFVLRYEVAGQAPEVAVIAHHDPRQGGYFTFLALPQKRIEDIATVPRDLIFVLDTSGSMRGLPLEKSKQAIYRLLEGMRPTDRFNIFRFAGDTSTLWPEPRPKTRENVARARQFVESLRGMGGTEMRQGIAQALAQPAEGARIRIAFLLTDGYVGNEASILESIEKERRGARVFTLGVGSSVNRYLLDQAAAVGLGEAFYIRQDEDARELIERFFKRVDRPNLAHIEIDWNGLDVSDLTPKRIPDLWQGQPIMVHGRYQKGGEAEIQVKGVLGSRSYAWPIKITLPTDEAANDTMVTVWARAKIRELMLEWARGGGRNDREVAEITDLGLKYRIMTQWTSFVAVEERQVNAGGEQKTLVQPVELPEGVDYQGVFGEADGLPQTAQGYRALSGVARTGGSLSRMMVRGIALGAPAARPPAPPQPGLLNRQAAAIGSVANSTVIGSVKTDVRVGRLSQSQSGLLNRQEAVIGTFADAKTAGAIKAKAAVPAAEPEEAPSACRYRTVSVSGGLRYPLVEKRLRQGWSKLCKGLQDHYKGPLTFGVVLMVQANGKVTDVALVSKKPLAKALADAIRDAFKKLEFGPVAGGGTAQIQLQLDLV